MRDIIRDRHAFQIDQNEAIQKAIGMSVRNSLVLVIGTASIAAVCTGVVHFRLVRATEHQIRLVSIAMKLVLLAPDQA